MPKQKPPLSVETLWQLQRVGPPALSPDGRLAVCAVTTPSLDDNRSAAALWLLPTDHAAPRQLTQCGDKDGQPAWSPRGDRIAFIARRSQRGRTDAIPQLYAIAADGGEAQRLSDFGPGVESFKWLPDGKRIVFAAWVWPDAEGAAEQQRRQRDLEARKASGYATSEAYYRFWDHNLPQGRVLHLLLLDTGSGKVRDLFEGTRFELPRDGAGNEVWDVSPDGRRIAFVHDTAAVPLLVNPWALSEIDLRSRRVRALADDAAWSFNAPRYSADGRRLACTAANVGRHHTAPSQLALFELAFKQHGSTAPGGAWRLLDADWDGFVNAPLRWSADGSALLFTAEARGRCHLWQYSFASGGSTVAFEGGWVQGFDAAGGTLAVAADSLLHPARLLAWRQGTSAPQRLEQFNDALLARTALGRVEEVSVTGALGEAVQMWLLFPPGFDPKKTYPLLQVIHGGPHAAAGDMFSWRWNPHLLASRGHVIAQVNYHGSSGFGFAFRHSLIGRQGQLELQDIEAGTDWLLRQPWSDASRVYAAGGSYGGFLVAWMNGHLPGASNRRYRAYICHAGVFDRVTTFSADSYSERPKDLEANYWQDQPRVLAQSPHAFAGQMSTPTLVIHGAQDFRVPDCNGLAYYNTLKARGVEARLLWFPDENHWVLKPRNSRQWYGEVLAWIGAAHEAPAR